jgi:hypothetical protein
MTYLIVKAALSGVIVMIVSEVARRSPGIGGLIASLPLVSILGIMWLWRDTFRRRADRRSRGIDVLVRPSIAADVFGFPGDAAPRPPISWNRDR